MVCTEGVVSRVFTFTHLFYFFIFYVFSRWFKKKGKKTIPDYLTVCLDELIYAGCPQVLFPCPSVAPAALLWTFFVDDFFWCKQFSCSVMLKSGSLLQWRARLMTGCQPFRALCASFPSTGIASLMFHAYNPESPVDASWALSQKVLLYRNCCNL